MLGAADPVRVFQNFATLDLLSNGRAEIVAAADPSSNPSPLRSQLEDYDGCSPKSSTSSSRSAKPPTSTGPANIAPRSPARASTRDRCKTRSPSGSESAARRNPSSAPELGLPLMVAIIGGEPHRFRPLIDLYREAGKRAGHAPEQLKVGIHALGYVADTDQQAADDFFPGYAEAFTKIGKERGWPPVTRAQFEALRRPTGALMVSDPETVANKMLQMNESLGGISRISFQMSVAALHHDKLLHAIELLGTRVAPIIRKALA